MTYALSGALQAAVYAALNADATLTGLVAGAIYDAVPSGILPATYVSLGAERVRDASDATGSGALHRIFVSVVTTQPGFSTAKSVAGAVSDVLHDADLLLSRGRLVFLRFERAEARRIDAGAGREIRMIFRARVEDD
ncbi:DUF3168 domain-containing protein [Sulfitobacter sp. D35]|uniref:DUF3168 domain-containing protein n=1 Tax=Sulfitobacter sp. D35 TaxID=3083252 RepID=UPI00296F00D3|nr:DUF3168 domain-containing protein [Sulfitobacter sp. D35]MDW4496815.1 DUF3168 domain-containing protein [Sulfitobacter sp. D35]